MQRTLGGKNLLLLCLVCFALATFGWAQTSSGMVNLDHVVRIEPAGIPELAAAIADDERDDEGQQAAGNGTIDPTLAGQRLI